MFIAHSFKENLAASTVEYYLSVIGYYHKLSNCNDMTQHFIIRKTLNGYHKMRSQRFKIAYYSRYLEISNIFTNTYM